MNRCTDAGSNVRAERARRNMSRKELATATGIAESTIGNYENGASAINFDNAVKLADAFGISLDELAGRTVA